ncbi:hypothetical protein [Liquorilactobacillus nagelii]|uniref:hypothetical protein n=1 Tax=Liquorilactobacillus nagelii TaxID=82688 RepID=UPI001CCE5BEF|nr:hypothetical protein [Liquorilactobacillus nagelii]ULQ49310.1 hypothetical protein J6864_10185 [Liquorilactobacillus nagelii]
MSVLKSKFNKKKFSSIIYLNVLFFFLALLYAFFAFHFTWLPVASDRTFHLQRLAESAIDLKAKKIPFIMTYSFGKDGQGINFFYPWIGQLPYLLPMIFMHDFVHAFWVGTVIKNFVGLLICYAALRIGDYSKKTALLFSVMYVFSTYLLWDTIPRFDMGESIANLFLPLVFICLIKLLQQSCKLNVNYILLLALGLSYITYSHLLTLILFSCVLISVIIIFFILKKMTWYSLIGLMASGVIYVLCTLAFWVPFMDQYLGTKITSPKLTSFDSSAVLSFDKLLENSLSNQINMSAPTIGFGLLLGTIIFLLNWRKFSSQSLIYFVSGWGLIFFSTNLFPWSIFSNTPVKIIQFSTRFLPFGNLLLCLAISLMVPEISSKILISNTKKLGLYLVSICLPIFFMLASTSLFNINSSENYRIMNQDNTFRDWSLRQSSAGAKFDSNLIDSGYPDYEPKTSKRVLSLVDNKKYIFDGKTLLFKNEDLLSYPNGIRYSITNRDHKIHKLILPFWIYNRKNYQLKVNGIKEKIIANDHHQLVLKSRLSQSTNYVDIRFKMPLIYRIVFVISFLVLASVILFVSYTGLRMKV